MIKLVIFASILLAVNLPIGFGFTSKRLGFVFLCAACFMCFAKSIRFKLNKRSFELLVFFLIWVVSGILGLIISENFTSTGMALFFTFVCLCLLSTLLDSLNVVDLKEIENAWFLSVCLLSALFIFQIFQIIEFNMLKIVFLRKYFLEIGYSINSTFNQVFVLIFCNILYLFIFHSSRLKKVSILILTIILIFLLFFSLSRQNLLVLIMLLVTISFFFTSAKVKLFGLVFFGGVISSVFYTSLDTENFSSISARIEKTTTQASSSDYVRVKQAELSIASGVTSPLIGVGLGGFYGYAKKEGVSKHARSPEASINQLLSEHGIIFTILFLAFFAYLLQKVYFYKAINNVQLRLNLIFLSFLLSISILFFFNEIHVQASIWALYLVYLYLMRSSKHGICAT